jgi:phospholipid/cholesterol/gamma-HCH transport system substrate-binding protein
MAERFQFRRVNEITGAFVLIVIAALIAGVIWTGRSQRWFKSNVTFRIVLPEAGAAGIRTGSEVYFLGTLVGSVSDVLVATTGRMEAEATIRRDFFRFVRADSSAVVKKKFGVAGDSFFEITRGEGKPLPEEHASIVCNEQFQSGFESAIEEIRVETLGVLKKTAAGLEKWSQLATELGESRKRLDLLTSHFEKMATDVEGGRGTVGKLLTETAVADDADAFLADARLAVSEWRGMITNLNTAAQSIQSGTTRLPEITEAVANETKYLPGLVQQSQASMREMERLIVAMEHHWLIRKYVTQTNVPALKKAASR